MAGSGTRLAFVVLLRAGPLIPASTQDATSGGSNATMLTLSILMMGLLAVSLTGCGGGLSAITGPSSVALQEMATAE